MENQNPISAASANPPINIPLSPQQYFSYATFEKRGGAFVIDTVILLVLSFIITPFLNLFIPLIFSWIGNIIVILSMYIFTLLFLYICEATPGKLLCGLQVKSVNFQKASLWQLIKRETFGKWISAIVFNLGYLWATFDDKNQTWHDKIGQTVVVNKNPITYEQFALYQITKRNSLPQALLFLGVGTIFFVLIMSFYLHTLNVFSMQIEHAGNNLIVWYFTALGISLIALTQIIYGIILLKRHTSNKKTGIIIFIWGFTITFILFIVGTSTSLFSLLRTTSSFYQMTKPETKTSAEQVLPNYPEQTYKDWVSYVNRFSGYSVKVPKYMAIQDTDPTTVFIGKQITIYETTSDPKDCTEFSSCPVILEKNNVLVGKNHVAKLSGYFHGDNNSNGWDSQESFVQYVVEHDKKYYVLTLSENALHQPLASHKKAEKLATDKVELFNQLFASFTVIEPSAWDTFTNYTKRNLGYQNHFFFDQNYPQEVLNENENNLVGMDCSQEYHRNKDNTYATYTLTKLSDPIPVKVLQDIQASYPDKTVLQITFCKTEDNRTFVEYQIPWTDTIPVAAFIDEVQSDNNTRKPLVKVLNSQALLFYSCQLVQLTKQNVLYYKCVGGGVNAIGEATMYSIDSNTISSDVTNPSKEIYTCSASATPVNVKPEVICH